MSVVPIWCLPRPFSQNTDFSKKALKTNKFWKIQNFFLHFWWQFYRAFQWYIVCFHTFSGCWYTEGNVFAVKSHPATTVKVNLNPGLTHSQSTLLYYTTPLLCVVCPYWKNWAFKSSTQKNVLKIWVHFLYKSFTWNTHSLSAHGQTTAE